MQAITKTTKLESISSAIEEMVREKVGGANIRQISLTIPMRSGKPYVRVSLEAVCFSAEDLEY
jgi:hypothetical protein